jgi:GGDEF domain-containing protein
VIRQGGDEFVVILEQPARRGRAQVAEKMPSA